jgi:hypothetical protein
MQPIIAELTIRSVEKRAWILSGRGMDNGGMEPQNPRRIEGRGQKVLLELHDGPHNMRQR